MSSPLIAVQVPVLETPMGPLCESVAISRYIASLGRSHLYPMPLNPKGDPLNTLPRHNCRHDMQRTL